MAVEQTFTVCRLIAKSSLVKSILYSTAFSDPKDVAAKLVVDQTNESNEKQVLAFQSRNHGTGGFFNGNNHRYNNINFNRGNSCGRGNYNSVGFYNRNNNNTGKDNYNINNCGRNRGDNNNNDYIRSNTTNHNVRTYTLNADASQQELLGDTQTIYIQ